MHPPHVAQRLHHRHLVRPWRCFRLVQGVEQTKPVGANLEGKRLPLFLTFRQTVIFHTATIPLEPNRLRRHTYPVRHDRGQIVQGRAERFGHQFKQVQIMHGAQHMRAVGALLAARLDQTARFEALKHRVQQQMLRSAHHEACAKLRQHAEVEARVGQLKAKGILPIDPGAHGVGRLTVAELLEKLKHRDQSQPPRRESRLAPRGVELAEVLILIKDAEFVT